jgi:hypothetical protein
MASVNKAILIGTVTAIPDFRVLENGTMMVNLQLETVSAGETEKHHVIFSLIWEKSSCNMSIRTCQSISKTGFGTDNMKTETETGIG